MPSNTAEPVVVDVEYLSTSKSRVVVCTDITGHSILNRLNVERLHIVVLYIAQ